MVDNTTLHQLLDGKWQGSIRRPARYVGLPQRPTRPCGSSIPAIAGMLRRDPRNPLSPRRDLSDARRYQSELGITLLRAPASPDPRVAWVPLDLARLPGPKARRSEHRP
jgi:hypothetical protein